MQIENVSFAGWQNNLRLFNPDVELIVSLDVGPRILSYRIPDHENVLKSFDEQMGQAGEDAFMVRGGHRLWLAPEDEKLTYHWDNEPVEHGLDESGMLMVTSIQREPWQIRKDLGIRIDEAGSRVEIMHRATNMSSEVIECATWGLTVLDAEGLCIIPQPPLGEHPRDLLPNRGLVIWPYVDLSDPRMQFGRHYWYVRQEPETPPFKIGLVHTERWVAYHVNGSLFLKVIDHVDGANYPDGGCNFETFTNADMIEIESLGPIEATEPGESVGHYEQWFLFDAPAQEELDGEEAVAEWMCPFLQAAGLAE